MGLACGGCVSRTRALSQEETMLTPSYGRWVILSHDRLLRDADRVGYRLHDVDDVTELVLADAAGVLDPLRPGHDDPGARIAEDARRPGSTRATGRVHPSCPGHWRSGDRVDRVPETWISGSIVPCVGAAVERGGSCSGVPCTSALAPMPLSCKRRKSSASSKETQPFDRVDDAAHPFTREAMNGAHIFNWRKKSRFSSAESVPRLSQYVVGRKRKLASHGTTLSSSSGL